MTLKTVVPELFREFPSLRHASDEELPEYRGEVPDAYPVFSDVLRPAVFAALDSGDVEATKRYFGFYERMAADTDTDVQSLVGIELIEDLANDKRRLALAWPYMGQHTRQEARAYAAAVKRQANREVSLPG